MTPAKARELLDAVRRRRQGARPGPRHRARHRRQGRSLRPLRHRGAADEETAALKGQGARSSRAPRACSRTWTSRPSTSTPRSSCSACRASSGCRPRRTAAPVEITAQNGRYGPYLKKGTDSRSLTTEQQLFDITLEEALAIYAQPKQRGRAAVGAAQGARQRPGVGQADGGQGRPLRPLRHRRRDQRDAAQGRRPRVDHARSAAPSCWPRSAPRAPTTRKRAAKKTTKKAATKKTAAKKTAKKAATKKA